MTYSTSGDSSLSRRHLPTNLPAAFLLTLLGLAGCGSNPAAPPAPASNSFSGSYGIYTTSSTSLAGVAGFVGNLQFDNGSVSGTLRPLTGAGSPCVEQVESENVHVTIDAANNLTLTVPISTGVATITASLPANPQNYVPGSYQIANGGICSTPDTPMILSLFAPATGTYTGTLNLYSSSGALIPGSALKISAVFTQSTFSDIYGQFMLSGTITASGACNESVSLRNSGAIGGIVVSQVFDGDLDPASDTVSYASFQDPFPTDPNCNKPYQGMLTRQ